MMNKGIKKAIVVGVVSVMALAGVVSVLKSDKAVGQVAYADEEIVSEEIVEQNENYGFYEEDDVDDDAENRNINLEQVEVNDKEVKIYGWFWNEEEAVTDYISKEENGVVTIDVKVRKRTEKELENATSDNVKFEKKFSQNVKTVIFCGMIVYDNGKNIVEEVANIYQNKLDSVSDTEKTTKLIYATALMQRETFDVTGVNVEGKNVNVELELFNEEIDDEILIKETLIKNSLMAMACAADLEKITWNYTLNGEVKTYALTLDEANKAVDMNVKDMAVNAKTLDDFCEVIELLIFDGAL